MYIFCDHPNLEARADRIAHMLDINKVNFLSESETDELHLNLAGDGLSLCANGMKLQADFTQSISRINPGRINSEMLVHAAKIKGVNEGLTAIDATAGFGEDSLLLAAAGFEVDLYEFDPVIFLLTEDAYLRAMENDTLKGIVSRMHIHNEDSIQALSNLDKSPDVILLDPMFPERTKTGSVKKKFQLLQQLEKPCSIEEELLNAAILAKPRKIVIKRPAKGPFLAGRKPDYSVPGKAIRYDVLFSTL